MRTVWLIINNRAFARWLGDKKQMLEVKHLTKIYGGKRAVDDVSFTVERGGILGFLGPNGAGKSTTMNMIIRMELFLCWTSVRMRLPIRAFTVKPQTEPFR
jgi:ABC-type glutathione transport system ATPase component